MKKMLGDYSRIESKLEGVLGEITSLKAKMDTLLGVKSSVIDGMPHGTDVSDSTYNKAQLFVDNYNNQLNLLLGIYNDTAAEEMSVKALLSGLTDEEMKIIELYYFNRLDWFGVSKAVNLSIRTCRRIRDAAIDKMREYT
ncbi:MAG: hypothetical protein LBT43_06745 [Prevotella sp.]|nr:hypothetical protein [Prevotella sp.]